MSARLMNCSDGGGAISKMDPVIPACGRTSIPDDGDKIHSEEKQSAWPLRFLFAILTLFVAVGGFLAVVGEALLGFGLVIGGVIVLPSRAALGGVLIVCGVGVFLFMIAKGINAVFGGR